MLQINQYYSVFPQCNNNLILNFAKPFSCGRILMFGNDILYKTAKSRLIITEYTNNYGKQ